MIQMNIDAAITIIVAIKCKKVGSIISDNKYYMYKQF